MCCDIIIYTNTADSVKISRARSFIKSQKNLVMIFCFLFVFLYKRDNKVESPFFHRENAALQKELKKAQELLQQSQTDYENLSTKYINVSAKVRE